MTLQLWSSSSPKEICSIFHVSRLCLFHRQTCFSHKKMKVSSQGSLKGDLETGKRVWEETDKSRTLSSRVVCEFFMRNEDLWPSEGVRSQDLYFFGWRDHWRYRTWWTFAGRGKKENPIQFLSSTARIRKFQFRTESYLLPCMSCLTSWEKSYLSPNSSPSLVTSSLLPVLFPQHHPSCPLFSFVICFLSWA